MKNWKCEKCKKVHDMARFISSSNGHYTCPECQHVTDTTKELKCRACGCQLEGPDEACCNCGRYRANTALFDPHKAVDPDSKTHNPHYTKMDIEPIDVMEQRVASATDVIGEDQNLLLALAIKHCMRAGLKGGQPWEKDIEKAKNYLHRALNGGWLE